MAGALEDLEAAAGHLGMGTMGVFHRDDPVGIAPNQHRGNLVDEVEPTGGVDALSSMVHHGAQRVEEGSTNGRFGERTV